MSALRKATLLLIILLLGLSANSKPIEFIISKITLDNPGFQLKAKSGYSSLDEHYLETRPFLDTICTSNTSDTLTIPASDKATGYTWSLPPGAVIRKNLADTSVIVDWRNVSPGLASICVAAENSCGTSTSSCLEVLLTHCNDKPLAIDDLQTIPYNTTTTIFIQNNDSDPDGDDLITSLDSSSPPNHGNVIVANNAIDYTPSSNYTGTDQFSYIICDTNFPSLCDTAVVNILVDHTAPIAVDDTGSTPASTPIQVNVLANDRDPEGGTLSTFMDPSVLPINGAITLLGNDIIYTPNAGFTGIDRFDYIVCDDGMPSKCSNATVTISVTNNAPIATNDTLTTPINTAVLIAVQANDRDPENGVLTTILSNTNLPTKGNIQLQGDNILYTPSTNLTGLDNFDYIVCDLGVPNLCDTATVFLTIRNETPFAIDDQVLTTVNQPIIIDALANDYDPENGLLSLYLEALNPAQNGDISIVNNEIQYTPNTNFTGTDQFNYYICDNAIPVACDTATVFVNIPNAPPIAIDDGVMTNANTSIKINVLGNDTDPEKGPLNLFLDPNQAPQNGTGIINNNQITYTPNNNFSGVDQFDYYICDSGIPSLCDTATVTISINNTAPVAVDDRATTTSNVPVTINVVVNDIDPEMGTLNVLLDPSELPEDGRISIINNQINYTPDNNFTGTDAFNYVICDTSTPSLCDTALVIVQVFNAAPLAVNDTTITTSNTPISVNVLNNDSDREDSPLNLFLETTAPAQNGQTQIINNQIVYTPTLNFTGQDQFNYFICDNDNPSLCDTASVFVQIENIAPIAINDTETTLSNVAVSINVLTNDSDPEDGVLSPSIDFSNPPKNGTVQIIGTQIIYTPALNFTGQDEFNYFICDNGTPSQCDTATVQVVIENRAPAAIDDVVSTTAGTLISIDILANDSDPENGKYTITLNPDNFPQNGIPSIVNNEIVYNPNSTFTGIDQFEYIVCDNGLPSLCDTALVTVNVNNLPPIAADDDRTTDFETAISINVTSNDRDPENGRLQIILDANQPADNGTTSIFGNNIVYTPNAGFTGMDQFDYVICDDGIPNLCDTATVSITINNQKPIAINDDVVTNPNQPIRIPVTNNDIDPEGGSLILSISPLGTPITGTISIEDMEIVYTPALDFTGMDVFEYIICDTGTPVLCDTASVQVTINNNAPIAIDDRDTTLSNIAVTIQVTTNDIDPENGLLTISIKDNNLPLNGRTSVVDNTIVYTPNAGFTGSDNFQYILCDNGSPSQCDEATVTVLVDNRSPIAEDDSFIVGFNETTSIDISINDSDPENGLVLVSLDPDQLPEDGIVSIINNGLNYTPKDNFIGRDSFDYIICDNGIPMRCDTASVFISIDNGMPTANDDTANTASDTPISIPVTNNDIDPENGPFIVTVLTSDLPENGGTQIIGEEILYTPSDGFSGLDTFTYEICDNGLPMLCDTATVYLTVSNGMPIANDDKVKTDTIGPIGIAVLANDVDPEDNNLTVTLDQNNLPDNGTVTIIGEEIIYIANDGFTGMDTLKYSICDNGFPALCDTASIVITVTNIPPLALDDITKTSANASVSVDILQNDLDPENGTLLLLLDDTLLPNNGQIEIIDNQIIYTPDTNYTGPDSFSYVLCDGGIPIQCDTALVTVVVANSHPQAMDDMVDTLSNVAILFDVISNDLDFEEGHLTVQIHPNILPKFGTATIINNQVLYDPIQDFLGIDSFDYIICDDGTPILCDTATVRITIMNRPPIAIDDTASTTASTPVIINILTNDIDPESGILTIILDPNNSSSNGTVTIVSNGGKEGGQNDSIQIGNTQIIYTPADGFVGTDTLHYIICDDGSPRLCDTARVIITILNEAPIATDDVYNTLEDVLITGNIVNNDIDPNTHPLTVVILDPAQHGQLLLQADGHFIYTPHINFNGKDSLRYTACDNIEPPLCDTAFVYINISAIADPPIATADLNTTLENTPTFGNITINDYDPDGDEIILTTLPITTPPNGTVSISEDGNYTYTPATGFIGEDQFTYEICDNATPSLCDTALVSIQVISADDSNNRPPVGVNDNLETRINTLITSNIISNDFDPDQEPFIITTTPINPPATGSLTINTIGTFEYQPAVDYTGQVQFDYQICDLNNPALCDTARVTIDILPNGANSTIAIEDAFIGVEDQSIQGSILTNDYDLEGDVQKIKLAPIKLPTKGTIVLQASGTFVYHPIKDYYGPDNFVYQVCDDGLPIACDIATVYLTILPVPDTLCNNTLTTPQINAETTACLNDTIQLFSTSTPPVVLENEEELYEYIWFNGRGDTIANTPIAQLSIAPSPLTISPFSMKVRKGACYSALSNLLSIDLIEVTDFSIQIAGNTDTICANTPFQLLGPSRDNVRYEWSYTDQAAIISTQQNLSLQGLEKSRSLQLTVISQECDLVSMDSVFIPVHEAPISNPSIVSGDAPVCNNGDLALSANIASPALYTFDWTGPNGFKSIEANPVLNNVSPLNNGLYTLTIRDRNSCASRVTNVSVTQIQEALNTPSINGNQVACQSQNINLYINENFAEGSSYEWTNALDLVISENKTLSINSDHPNAISPYRVRVIMGDCATNFSTAYEVVTEQAANSFALSTQLTTCVGGTLELQAKLIDEVSYEWRELGNPTIISTDITTILTNITQDATYELTAINHQCANKITKDTVPITISNSIELNPSAQLLLKEDCGPGNLLLNANVPSDLEGYTYQWIGPNGFTSSLSSDTLIGVTQAANGRYTLVVSAPNGCSTSASVQVTAIQNTLAFPRITSSTGPVCENANLLLSAPIYDGYDGAYTWYRNGQVINEQNSNELFIDNAQVNDQFHFSIALAECALSSKVFTPIVFEKPKLSLNNSFDILCSTGVEDLSILTTIQGGQTPYNIEWKGPNGFYSANVSPTIVNTNETHAGTYTINVSDQNNCVVEASTEVDIIAGLPTPILELTGNVCAGDPMQLATTNYANYEANYEWVLPNGLTASAAKTITIPSNNQYIGAYVLKVEWKGCSAVSDTLYIESLNNFTAAPLAVYNKTEDCAPSNLELFANAVGSNLSYQWTGPNGFTSSLANPVIINASPVNNGIYELHISNGEGCSIIQATNTIDNIQEGFSEPVLQTSGLTCAGGYITLTAPIYEARSVSYNWYVNGEPLENEHSHVLVAGPLSDNKDQYHLSITADGCTIQSDPYFADVLESMEITPTYSYRDHCENDSLLLSATFDATAENLKFLWQGPNGYTAESIQPFISNPTQAYNGTYTLSITNETGCVSTASLTINDITAAATIPVIVSESVDCNTEFIRLSVLDAIPSGQYTWTNGQGVIIGSSAKLELAINDTTAIGPYTVTLSTPTCAALTSLPYQVDLVEQPLMQVSNNGPICAGMDVELIATEIEGATYRWYDSGGVLVATQRNPILQNVVASSDYEVEISLENCPNAQRLTTTVLIENRPEIANISKSATFCEGEAILLSAENRNATGEMISYTWTGPNNFIYTDITSHDSFDLSLPSLSLSQAGSYTLNLSTSSGCEAEPRSVLVNIIPGIVAPNLLLDESAVCAGSTLNFQAQTNAVTEVSFEWYIQKDSATSPQLLAITETSNFKIENATSEHAGDYMVKVRNTQCASNFSNANSVIVFDTNTDLTAISNATADSPGCYGETIQLSLPFYSNATYNWFGPNGFTSNKYNPVIENATANNQGEYFAIVEIEGCTEMMAQAATVVINPKPAKPTIINNGPICKGDDLVFQVNSIIENQGDVRFDWFNEAGVLMASTEVPIREYTNVPASFANQYYVEIVANGCTSEPSDLMTVGVNNPTEMFADAGEDQIICAAASVQLAATAPSFGKGTWMAITGGILEDPNVANTSVSQLNSGDNIFIWTVEDAACSITFRDTVTINIGNLTDDTAHAGDNVDLCEEYTTTLNAQPVTESIGRWTQSAAQSLQGVTITNPLDPQTTISNLDAGNSYSFTWTISQTNCPDFEKDELIINVSDIPNENALIADEALYLCEDTQTSIEAELPNLSMGEWFYVTPTDSSSTPANPVRIAAAGNASTFVEDLPTGENVFVWTLSNGACTNFSTDTLRIFTEGQLIAEADDFVINLNDSLNINVLENDIIDNRNTFNIVITKYPDFGTLIEKGEGIYMYQPTNNYFGNDDFRYKLCNVNCEAICDTAVVNLGIEGTEGSGACFIPNIISPNDDGNNDLFTVACIADFPDNQLQIFNRWGDKVYSAAPYNNDWAGKHDNQDLPAGTYFYILQLTTEGEPIQGFITIFR